MPRHWAIVAALAAASCSADSPEPPEVAACEAFTLSQLPEPASYHRTAAEMFDTAYTAADYAERAGYARAPAAVRTIGREMLKIHVGRAVEAGGAGKIGVRSVLLRFTGGGAGGISAIPADTNVCEFTTIDGRIPVGDDLARRVERAKSTAAFREQRDALGIQAMPIAEPKLPCCLVP